MKKLCLIIFMSAVCNCLVQAQPTNDNATIAIWQMDSVMTNPSTGQPYVADDDYGTHSFNSRVGHLTLGGTPNQWASNPTATADKAPVLVSEGRPGGSGYSLQYDGVNDWSAALNVWNGADFEYGSVEVEFWFKPLSLPSGTNVVYVLGATNWEIRLRGDGQLQFFTRDANNTARFRLSGAGAIVVNKWHYVKFKFQDGEKILSIMNEDETEPQVWTSGGFTPMGYLNAGVYIGGSPSGSFNVNMLISEMKISVPDMPGVDENWQSPYSDNMDTLAMLHFDELMDPNYAPEAEGVFTPDNNSFNPRRRPFHAKLFDFGAGTSMLADSVSPEFGKCIEFDGWDDRVLVAYRDMYDYVAKENLRIEAWVKLGDEASDIETGQEYSIVSQLYSFRCHYIYEGAQWNLAGIFGYEVGGTFYGSTLKVPVANPRQWNHIALQWHRGMMSLYINGELKDRRFNRDARELRPSSTRLAVGSRDPNPGSSKFLGFIDEVRFVSTVSTQPPCADGTAGYLAGDINRDCNVDILDFAMLADQWMQEIDTSDVYDWSVLDADVSYNRIVDEADLVIMTNDWLNSI